MECSFCLRQGMASLATLGLTSAVTARKKEENIARSRNVRNKERHEFSDSYKLALWCLVKLFESGYTPVPIFGEIKLIEDDEFEDDRDWHFWRKFLASDRNTGCKVWISMSMTLSTWYVKWILVSLKPQWKERFIDENVAGRMFYMSYSSLPPKIQNLPKVSAEDRPIGNLEIKLLEQFDKKLGWKEIDMSFDEHFIYDEDNKLFFLKDTFVFLEAVAEAKKISFLCPGNVLDSYEIGILDRSVFVKGK